MAGLKEIRTRITSVKSTRQITQAMKMVAAAKLRKNQEKILMLRPYANKLEHIMASIRQGLENDVENPLMQDRPPEKVLLILVTSNRGLCGAFNNNAIAEALEVATTEYATQWKQKQLSFFAIGKKGADFLKSKKYPMEGFNTEIFDKLDFTGVVELETHFTDLFLSGKYDRIDFIYNQFKNAAVHLLTHETFLPVVGKKEKREESGIKVDYIFEPTRDELINDLIPKTLRIQFYKVLLDSFSAEHGARMTAMHQATDNANELIKELTLHYNKARQAAITKEILDIVGGAEALKQ
ncbi:MAG: ATP synthase F1 subunit gamma [Bacteroidales bacterium]|nr:ATP synthase F1 subunit gamma [Bacteroidales bacterium]